MAARAAGGRHRTRTAVRMGAHILVVDDDPILAAALRRPRGRGATELRFGDVRMDRSTREVWRGERTISLTRQEFDLLGLFLEHPRQVLPRSTILERVWDYDFGRDSNVLEVYVGYLRRK